ncbi:hypothetical protein ACH6CV_01285 [Bacillota bacterium Meth-B3]|nr:hypothetical protein [Christensenellaceae bacterium]
MSKKYDDLAALIREDAGARAYYNRLPDYVKDQMSARSDSINSFESLQDYAENLTRGDG